MAVGSPSTLPAAFAVAAVFGYLGLFWLPINVDVALYGLALLALPAIALRSPERCGAWPLPDAALLLYLLICVVTILRADDLARSLALSTAWLPGALLYLLISRWGAGASMVGATISGLAVLAGGLSLLVGYAVIAGSVAPGTATGDLADVVHSPILIVPNDILVSILAVPLIMGQALSRQRWPWLLAASAVAAAVLIAAVLLQSRTALLSLCLGLAVLVMRLPSRPNFRQVIGGVAVVLLLTLMVDACTGFGITHKLGGLCFSRWPFWLAAWSLFLERPWFGQGAHSFVHLYQAHLPSDPALFCAALETRLTPWPHNLVLELLSSQGLLGALPFLLAIGWGLVASWALTRHADPAMRSLGAGLLGAWLAFSVAAMLELSLLRLWVVVLFACLLGLTVRLRCLAAALVRW